MHINTTGAQDSEDRWSIQYEKFIGVFRGSCFWVLFVKCGQSESQHLNFCKVCTKFSIVLQKHIV